MFWLHISTRTAAGSSVLFFSFALWLWLRAEWAAPEIMPQSFRDRQVALINRLRINMRIIQQALPPTPLTTACTCVCVRHFLSMMHMTFPYVPPGETPKKYHLKTQMPSLAMVPKCQRLSVGFNCFPLTFCFSFFLSTRCQMSALMCYKAWGCERKVTHVVGCAQLDSRRGFCIWLYTSSASSSLWLNRVNVAWRALIPWQQRYSTPDWLISFSLCK